METSIYELVGISAFSGLLGGLLGPWVNNKLASEWWKYTKRHDLKYEAFKSALNAIGALEADILDTKLQNQNEAHENIKALTNFRTETRQCIENAKGLIKTWYSDDVYSHFEKVLQSKLSLKNAPCSEHEDRKMKFIVEAAKEIKII